MRFSLRKWCVVGLLLLGASTSTACGQTEQPEKRSQEGNANQANIETFDYVVKQVPFRHWDFAEHREKWEATQSELREKIVAGANRGETRQAIKQLLGTLGESHFGVIPKEVYDIEENVGGTQKGTAGIELRLLDDHFFVFRVSPGSAADKAGVKPGWELIKVDGKGMQLDSETEAKARADVPENMWNFLRIRVAESKLDGMEGDKKALEFLVNSPEGTQQEKKIELQLAEPTAHKAKFGELPAFFVEYESRKVDEKVGYIRLGAFFDPGFVSQKFSESLTELKDCEGIILDLRGNPGGIGAMAFGLSGFLISEKGKSLGVMVTKDSKVNFVVFPRKQQFAGKVAILIDNQSASTSEVMAGGLQELGRARVFGETSAGAVLPSSIEKLPNGDRFQAAYASFISPLGNELEGRGVIPDELVFVTPSELLQGKDAVIEKAADWIRNTEPK